jgi:hypothetical protein
MGLPVIARWPRVVREAARSDSVIDAEGECRSSLAKV